MPETDELGIVNYDGDRKRIDVGDDEVFASEVDNDFINPNNVIL